MTIRTIMGKDKKYKWEFENIGGSLRVKISSGKDLAHLEELDPKMWTALSCPVKGLEIDDKSLAYIDSDGDGKIRVNDMIAVSKWITGAVKDKDGILKGKDSVSLDQFNADDAVGAKLLSSAKQILSNLGKESDKICLADTADIAAIFSKTRFNGDGVVTEASAEDADDKAAIAAAVTSLGGVLDRSGAMGVNAEIIEAFYKAMADYASWNAAAVELPFGADTDKALAAYNALDAKVKDFFMRSKLAAFSPDSTASLDVQPSRIDSISAENLMVKTDEISSYPLARVTGKPEIPLDEPVNPAWASHFETIKSVLAPSVKSVTEASWAELGAMFSAYTAWQASKAGAVVEGLGMEAVKDMLAKDRKSSILELIASDIALKEEADNIEMVDKFLHIYRDFYRLVRNFVTFNDFYDKKSKAPAIFQCGKLIVDQRECRLCMHVADAAKHNATAAVSGMYLVYCDCVTKTNPSKLQIVAAVTVGEVGDLFVGKNAIFYDNAGLEWDAVITKIIDNPISVAQAFWSPYRRMAKVIEDLITKNAADKDAKIMSEATAKINAAPASIPASPDGKPATPPPFDIGKFAGIFAALGMALGMIGTALTKIFEGVFALQWWQLILAFVAIMLVISGPAMVMAWLKLRRRNIAPLLNANGWAINAASKISIPFGETLTDQAKFPKMRLKDPYAKKGLAPWKKWMISFAVLAVVAAGLWVFNLMSWAGLRSPLPRYNQTEVIEEVVQETEVLPEADTLTVETEEIVGE